MNGIVQKLEAFSDGEECVVVFADGDVLHLKDCEGVDASIYNRKDLVVARLVAIVRGNRTHSQTGSMIEFSTDDIMSINGDDVANLK